MTTTTMYQPLLIQNLVCVLRSPHSRTSRCLPSPLMSPSDLPEPMKGLRCEASMKQLTSAERDHTALTDRGAPTRDRHRESRGKKKEKQE